MTDVYVWLLCLWKALIATVSWVHCTIEYIQYTRSSHFSNQCPVYTTNAYHSSPFPFKKQKNNIDLSSEYNHSNTTMSLLCGPCRSFWLSSTEDRLRLAGLLEHRVTQLCPMEMEIVAQHLESVLRVSSQSAPQSPSVMV